MSVNPQRRGKIYTKVLHHDGNSASAIEFRDSLGNAIDCDFIRVTAWGTTNAGDLQGFCVVSLSAGVASIPASSLTYVDPVHTMASSGIAGIVVPVDSRGSHSQEIYLPQGQSVNGAIVSVARATTVKGIIALQYGRTVTGNAMDGLGSFIGN